MSKNFQKSLWRAPLWERQVDPKTGRLETERAYAAFTIYLEIPIASRSLRAVDAALRQREGRASIREETRRVLRSRELGTRLADRAGRSDGMSRKQAGVLAGTDRMIQKYVKKLSEVLMRASRTAHENAPGIDNAQKGQDIRAGKMESAELQLGFEFTPAAALLGPGQRLGDLTERGFGERVASGAGCKLQNFPLDVGSEPKELHHLAKAFSGDGCATRDRGITSSLAGAEHLAKEDGEGHQLSDARQAAGLRRSFVRAGGAIALVQVELDGGFIRHVG